MPRSPQPPPGIPLLILKALLPPAEREEVITDIASEYAHHVAVSGLAAAKHWLWRQALGSAPALLRWNWWRGWSGFQPHANAYRPGGPMLKYLVADIRYAARRLTARAGYTLLAVLTLALGIGGTAAVFGVARPVIFDPLPYPHEKEVTYFWMGGSWNEQEFTYLRGKFPGYRTVAFYRPAGITLKTGDAPISLQSGIFTSYELFDVLGTKPYMGRDFKQGDDAPGAEPVAIISYGLWRDLGADQSIIGKHLTLDGAERTVIGVMPRGFWYPDPSTRVWLPREINPEGQNGSYTLIGHVSKGLDPAHMEAQTKQLTAMLGERFKYDADWDKTKNASVMTLRDAIIGPMRPAIIATFVAMGLILLIACTNVAALMLGQVEGRGTELAVRAALGANRKRLTQPLIVEALLIGVLAACVGGALAMAGFGVLAQSLPIGTWIANARFDWTLFAFALAIAIGASLLVVLIPSTSLWRSDLRGDLASALSRARTGGISGGSGGLERTLVVVEVALAMLIASGATLLVRSVSNLYSIDPGIETKGIAVIDAVSSASMTAPERSASINAIIEALGAIPGVKTASAAQKIPLRGGGNSFGITVEGREQAERTSTYFRIGSARYFETLGYKVVKGRGFDITDQPREGEIDVVINEELARKYFPGEDPLNKRLGGGFRVPQRIVGVVKNVAEGALTDPPAAARYYLAGQVSLFGNNSTFVIRMNREADAAAVLDQARKELQRVAPSFAVQNTTTMSRVFDEAVGPARQIMTLLAILSSLALVLGAVGIYGVISHFAQRRRRDWAIRVALGLPGSRVVAKIVGQGATLVGIGVVLGAIGTLALSRLLTTFLYGVSAVDPIAFIGASAALLLTGILAALIPAWRAGTVDPALVLREQQ